MAYDIVIFRDDRELSRTPCEGDLGSAKARAIDEFKLQYEQNSATSVRVLDGDGRVVFSYSEQTHVPQAGG